MTIKGTLETFNLRELLQMLAFNQKVGTLRLETERGTRTIYVDHGRASLFTSDMIVSDSMVRLLTRNSLADPERMQRAIDIARKSNRFVGDVLTEMGILTSEMRDGAFEEVVSERLFHAQLTAIHRFEFLDGESVGPNGPDEPIEPYLSVDSLLLELTRRLDQWQQVQQVIPSIREVFEGTGQGVDLADREEVDAELANRVVPCINGYRNLEQLADASSVDLFHVAQVLAALFEGGGVRPVPTDDLIQRADERLREQTARDALPLLRLAIERGDAPVDARLRLATALEQSGETEEAAAELDSYAALNADRDPSMVFDALKRALSLRNGDVPTASRLCDYYLGNRSRLRAVKSEALDALRTLIQTGMNTGRPLEAAHRLGGFIENGDAPSEDLLILADLYVAANRPQEAASALSQRAEDLMVAGRVAPARDLFRRALQCDPSLTGARRRLQDIDGERKRLSHRRRVNVTLTLVLLVASGIAGAWWLQSRQANRAITQVQRYAETALDRAESKGEARIKMFTQFLDKTSQSDITEAQLNEATSTLLKDIEDIVAAPQKELSAYAAEAERVASSGSSTDAHRIILRGLEQRRRQIQEDARLLVVSLAKRAALALKNAESEFKEGSVRTAFGQLRVARNLGFSDPPTRERAVQLLRHVERYLREYDAASSSVRNHIDEGRFEDAFHEAVKACRALLDSDLAKDIPFPVEVTSDPTGAEVWLGGEPTGEVTPCVLTYTAYAKDTTLRLRLPGHRTATTQLPSYKEISEDAPIIETWEAHAHLVLSPGPRWISPARGKNDLDFWLDRGVPVVLRDDGRTIQALEVNSGTPQQGSTAEAGMDPMRLGGRLGDGTEWRIRGQRTLWVSPDGGDEWKAHTLGRLERRPTLSEGVVCVADTTGTLYGYEVQTGKELWRRSLGGRPTQRPYASSLGFVMGTHRGGGFRIDPKTGAVKDVAPAANGPALVLPLGRGVVFLGGGERGARVLRPNGTIDVRGDAAPDVERTPWVSKEGAAWLENGRVRWISSEGGTATSVGALGNDIVHIGGGEGDLVGVSGDGVLRVVDPTDNGRLFWEAPLGRAPQSAPRTNGHSVFIMVEGGLAAVER